MVAWSPVRLPPRNGSETFLTLPAEQVLNRDANAALPLGDLEELSAAWQRGADELTSDEARWAPPRFDRGDKQPDFKQGHAKREVFERLVPRQQIVDRLAWEPVARRRVWPRVPGPCTMTNSYRSSLKQSGQKLYLARINAHRYIDAR
jgi:hypothetical protein